MPQPESNLWFGVFVIAAATASLTTWLLLFARYRLGPYLEYQPRRPVPWGPAAAILATLMVFVAFLQAPELDPSAFTTTYDLVQRIAMGTLQVFFVTGVFFAVVVAASGATQRDLGLPELASDLGHDMRIGAVVCLAALVPVVGLQALLIRFLGQPTPHPLVEIVLEDRHPAVMVMALIAAVIIAPVCEEIAFRLLLQGWLEKWEDRWANPPAAVDTTQSIEDTETRGQGDQETEDPETSPCPPVSLSPCLDATPPSRGVAGLPRGWLPIGISSLLFALAHIGHGTDPVPLFLLALMLGYTYQRTHHIVPCIVTHMLFNLVSLIALGLTIYAR